MQPRYETLVIHGIRFNVDSDVEITDDIKRQLTESAERRIRQPVAVRPRRVPDGKYRYNYAFASPKQQASGAPVTHVGIDGVTASVLRLGDPPVELDGTDIAIVKEILLQTAYVSESNGRLCIDFD